MWRLFEGGGGWERVCRWFVGMVVEGWMVWGYCVSIQMYK